MKFSEIDQEQWGELQPYLDTCLLPVTGLSGTEPPWQATRKLEELADALELLEIPYKGRVVTYPAFHYSKSEQAAGQADAVCRALKEGGFAYVIAVASDPDAAAWELAFADLLLVVDPARLAEDKAAAKADVFGRVQQLWHGK